VAELTDDVEVRPTRRRPDPVTLLVGLMAIAVAVMAFVGKVPAFDPRWVLAGGAVVAGLMLLVASLRR
jgi:hypothetical protein